MVLSASEGATDRFAVRVLALEVGELLLLVRTVFAKAGQEAHVQRVGSEGNAVGEGNVVRLACLGVRSGRAIAS